MEPMSWLEVIRQDLKQISDNDFIEPSAELEESEEVLGEVSPHLRRLWTLTAIMQKKAALAKVEMVFHSVPARREELRAQVWELTSKAETLRKLFWIEVNDEFSSWSKHGIGIRRGWKVIVCDENPFSDILRRIFGS